MNSIERTRIAGAPVLVALIFLAGACAARKPPSTEPSVKRFAHTGLASWYGKKFHGRRTASGERFDMHALTAAHPTLPFGSIVEVTNLENRRSVKVRINDRGPSRKDRVIDLSYAAAEHLGMVRRGVVRVKIRLVERARG